MKLSVVLVLLISVVSFLRHQSVNVTDMAQETAIMERFCLINDFSVNLTVFLDVKHCGLG
jgi:hypothetical protein